MLPLYLCGVVCECILLPNDIRKCWKKFVEVGLIFLYWMSQEEWKLPLAGRRFDTCTENKFFYELRKRPCWESLWENINSCVLFRAMCIYSVLGIKIFLLDTSLDLYLGQTYFPKGKHTFSFLSQSIYDVFHLFSRSLLFCGVQHSSLEVKQPQSL